MEVFSYQQKPYILKDWGEMFHEIFIVRLRPHDNEGVTKLVAQQLTRQYATSGRDSRCRNGASVLPTDVLAAYCE